MTMRTFKPTEDFAQTTGGAIVLVGVMFVSLPLLVVGLVVIGIARWASRSRASKSG